VALRIKGKGSVFQHVPVTGVLSAALLEWKGNQESFKGKRILAPGGIAFAGSQFVFAGYSGEPFSNRAFNLRLRAACRAIGVGRSPPTGCATARPPSSSTTWEKIFGRSRNYSATRIFGPPSAIPTSGRPGRRPRRQPDFGVEQLFVSLLLGAPVQEVHGRPANHLGSLPWAVSLHTPVRHAADVPPPVGMPG